MSTENNSSTNSSANSSASINKFHPPFDKKLKKLYLNRRRSNPRYGLYDGEVIPLKMVDMRTETRMSKFIEKSRFTCFCCGTPRILDVTSLCSCNLELAHSYCANCLKCEQHCTCVRGRFYKKYKKAWDARERDKSDEH